jgi:hypothetical protein
MDIKQKELREKLSRQIQQAFSNVKFEHTTWHTNPSWQLKGKHWREIPLDMLKRDGFMFALRTDEDGAFFLPAFLNILLTSPEELEGYEQGLLQVLTPVPNNISEESDSVSFAYLNKEQKLVILAFIKAYPKLFPHLFDIKTFSNEVNEAISELMSKIDLNLPLPTTPYEDWEKAVTFWKSKVEE